MDRQPSHVTTHYLEMSTQVLMQKVCTQLESNDITRVPCRKQMLASAESRHPETLNLAPTSNIHTGMRETCDREPNSCWGKAPTMQSMNGVENKRGYGVLNLLEASIVRKIPELSLLQQQLCRHKARGISGLEGAVCAIGRVDIGLFELAKAAPLLVIGSERLTAASLHTQWQTGSAAGKEENQGEQ